MTFNNKYKKINELKRKFNIINTPPKAPRKMEHKINYTDGYINKDEEYYKKYSNKTIKNIINQIYKEKEIKLNDDYDIINYDEYKFIINSLYADDFIKFNSYSNIRIKLYNHINKPKIYNIDNLGWLFKLLISVFNEDEILKDCYNILIIKDNIKHFENIKTIEKWQIKYLIYLFKIMALFDVPFLESHQIIKHRRNKYNFIQHKFLNSGDLDFGDFENWGDGADFYFNNYIFPVEDEEIKKGIFYNKSKVFIKKFNYILFSKNEQE
jgi:hypothetical protein